MANNSEFQAGDILRFFSAGPLHYAVYIGDGEIVHYNGLSSKLKIMREELTKYKKRSNVISVVKVTYQLSGQPYSPSEIKERAVSCIDKKGYNVLTRNCEHFATWCVYGKKVSGNVRVGLMGGGTAAAPIFGSVTGAVIGGAIGSVIPVVGTIVGAGVGTLVGTGIGVSVGIIGAAVGWSVNQAVHIVKNEEDEF